MTKDEFTAKVRAIVGDCETDRQLFCNLQDFVEAGWKGRDVVYPFLTPDLTRVAATVTPDPYIPRGEMLDATDLRIVTQEAIEDGTSLHVIPYLKTAPEFYGAPLKLKGLDAWLSQPSLMSGIAMEMQPEAGSSRKNPTQEETKMANEAGKVRPGWRVAPLGWWCTQAVHLDKGVKAFYAYSEPVGNGTAGACSQCWLAGRIESDVDKSSVVTQGDSRGALARAHTPDAVAGCRLGCSCKQHGPVKAEPWRPSVDDLHWLKDA